MEGHDQKAMIDLGMKRLEEIRVLGGGAGSERHEFVPGFKLAICVATVLIGELATSAFDIIVTTAIADTVLINALMETNLLKNTGKKIVNFIVNGDGSLNKLAAKLESNYARVLATYRSLPHQVTLIADQNYRLFLVLT